MGDVPSVGPSPEAAASASSRAVGPPLRPLVSVSREQWSSSDAAAQDATTNPPTHAASVHLRRLQVPPWPSRRRRVDDHPRRSTLRTWNRPRRRPGWLTRGHHRNQGTMLPRNPSVWQAEAKARAVPPDEAYGIATAFARAHPAPECRLSDLLGARGRSVRLPRGSRGARSPESSSADTITAISSSTTSGRSRSGTSSFASRRPTTASPCSTCSNLQTSFGFELSDGTKQRCVVGTGPIVFRVGRYSNRRAPQRDEARRDDPGAGRRSRGREPVHREGRACRGRGAAGADRGPPEPDHRDPELGPALRAPPARGPSERLDGRSLRAPPRGQRPPRRGAAHRGGLERGILIGPRRQVRRRRPP